VRSETVFARTSASWRLAFMYAGQTVHFLIRAVFLSLASVGLVLAWLCCWLDRFRSSRAATAWIIPLKAPAQSSGRHGSISLMQNPQPRTEEKPKPRTIDGLIRNKGIRV